MNSETAEEPKLTECTLCRSRFSNPKLLPCIHTFCLNCLKKLFDDNQAKYLSCPLCHTKVNIQYENLEKLCTNTFAKTLAEIEEHLDKHVRSRDVLCDVCDEPIKNYLTEKFCTDCNQYFCKSCLQCHNRMNLSRDHNAFPIAEIMQSSIKAIRYTPRYCSQHMGQNLQGLLQAYCLNCEIPVCKVCMTTIHQEHSCKDLNLAREEILEIIDERIPSLLDRLRATENETLKLGEACSNFESKVKRTLLENQNQIKTRCDDLRKDINNYEQLLLDEAQFICNEDIKIVNEFRDQVLSRDKVNRMVYLLELLKEYGAPQDIVANSNILLKYADSIITSFSVDKFLQQESNLKEKLLRPDSKFIPSLNNCFPNKNTIGQFFNVGEITHNFIEGLDLISANKKNIITDGDDGLNSCKSNRNCLITSSGASLNAENRGDLVLEKLDTHNGVGFVDARRDDSTADNNVSTVVKFDLEKVIVIIGPDSGRAIQQEVYHIKLGTGLTDKITPHGEPPALLDFESASCVMNNVLYAVGIGKAHDEMWRWIADTDDWKKCAGMPSGRQKHCVVAVDNNLYVLGGCNVDDRTPLSSVLCYDIIGDTWMESGNLCAPCEQATGIAFKQSIFVFGGRKGPQKSVDSVQIFDTKSNETNLAENSFPINLRLMRSIRYEKYAVIIGRYSSFLYNMETLRWAKRPRFKTDYWRFGLTLDGDMLYVMGGGIGTTPESHDFKLTDAVKCLSVADFINDKETASWQHYATLPAPAMIHSYSPVSMLVRSCGYRKA